MRLRARPGQQVYCVTCPALHDNKIARGGRGEHGQPDGPVYTARRRLTGCIGPIASWLKPMTPGGHSLSMLLPHRWPGCAMWRARSISHEQSIASFAKGMYREEDAADATDFSRPAVPRKWTIPRRDPSHLHIIGMNSQRPRL
jgi:hypothetical protein